MEKSGAIDRRKPLSVKRVQARFKRAFSRLKNINVRYLGSRLWPLEKGKNKP